MTCPFLSETRVRYCHAATVRKMFATGQGDLSSELCSTGSHTSCAVYQSHATEASSGGACPLLHETLAHYCSAAPILKFIPFSDQAGRCGGSGYRFCDLYLGFKRAGDQVSAPRAGSIRVPGELYYSPNHMWLHIGPNGTCHIGIDEFFASALRLVDSLVFVTTGGVDKPSAVLSVQGVDWPVSFRNRVLITGAHVYLRSNPARLTEDPYGAGWLFEACELPDSPVREGLMPGAQALRWMEHECRRFDEALHEIAREGDGSIVNDGGTAVEGALDHLEREGILRMLHSFFAPDRGWGEELSR